MAANAHGTATTSDGIAALIAAGSHREAAARCAREHARVVGRLCMAMLGDQGEADEAMQEALLAAYRAMPSYRAEGTVRAWLLQITRRTCAKRLAMRAKRRARHLQLVHDAEAPADTPAELVEQARRARVVRAALEHLKPTEREVIALRYESGLSYREVAVAAGIEEAAARKRVSRGLRRLHQLLKDEVES